MTHYVLIDNHSGYVWGEADANDPVEACAAVDREIGGDEREYAVERLGSSTKNGYHVFEAPADWTPVDDGQNQREIERVESACRKVAEVAFRTAAASAGFTVMGPRPSTIATPRPSGRSL